MIALPRIVKPLILTVLALALALPLVEAAETAPVRTLAPVDPLDRDGDGEMGEVQAINARVRNYLERHGDDDRVSADAM